MADQIGGKDNGSVQEGNQHNFLVLVFTINFLSKTFYPLLNLLFGQQYFLEVVFSCRFKFSRVGDGYLIGQNWHIHHQRD